MKKSSSTQKRICTDAMIRYINGHLMEEITLKALGDACGYSHYHASKVFKEVEGISPFEYIRKARMVQAINVLQQTNNKILDIALSLGFNSHEGFTRSFSSHFGISPIKLRSNIRHSTAFMPMIRKGDIIVNKTEDNIMDSNIICTQVIERPKRKLIIMRAKKANHYYEYCEEIGCDVWGKLLAVKGALYEPIGMWMPEKLRPEGTSVYTQGVEVWLDYDGKIPEGMEVIELAACKYMVFQGQPYPTENEDENMEQAIVQLQQAMKNYDPKTYGWEWDDDIAPRIQLSPIAQRGYIEARPVCAIK